MYTYRCHNKTHVHLPTSVTIQNVYTYRCHNTKHVHPTLSQYKTCTPTAVTIKNMYTYRCHNTNMYTCHSNAKHVETANIIVYFRDTFLQTCQTAKQQRCGNLKFRSCYISNLTRLVDRSLYSYSNNETVSRYALYKSFSLHFNTFKTILEVKSMFMNFNS